MRVPHGVRLRSTLASAALDRHLLHTDPPLPLTTIEHHSRVGRPAIGVLENPLEHRAVCPLNYDETPKLYHGVTMEAWVGSLQKRAKQRLTSPATP
jgi:hypothetical protein